MGENLAASMGYMPNLNKKSVVKKGINGWYDEIDDWSFATSSRIRGVTGHFTQVRALAARARAAGHIHPRARAHLRAPTLLPIAPRRVMMPSDVHALTSRARVDAASRVRAVAAAPCFRAQLVWKNTDKVGAYVAVKDLGNNQKCAMYVANYVPPGNYGGQYAANVMPLK